jgi:hypothetical protein
MSSNYYWQNMDITNVTDVTTTSSAISSYFADFPASTSTLADLLASEPAGFITNAPGAVLSGVPAPNASYFCYNDDEETTAPQFLLNGKSIFTTTFSNSRIIVKTQTISNASGTIDIPDWCNGVKVKFVSTKGSNGTAGTGVIATNTNSDAAVDTYNYNYHRDEHKNYDGGLIDNFHYNKDDHQNIHHNNHANTHFNWSAQNGGAGGQGGNGKIGWYYKAILFDAGTNNKLIYNIETVDSGSSNITVKSNSVTKAEITYTNGGPGNNGTNAQARTTNNTTTITHIDNYDDTNANNNINHHHNNNAKYIQAGSTAGTAGTAGTDGTATLTDTFEYLYFNSSLTNQSNKNRLLIYYFRFND